MSISEITEEKDEEGSPFIAKAAQKERIRRILEQQKSLYLSSSSSSSSSSSMSSSSTAFSSSRRRGSLLELMKGGNTCLRRLFDMEHTSLANYFEDYSASSVIKSIPLWGSDSDREYQDPWASIKHFGTDSQTKLASEGSFMDGGFSFGKTKPNLSNRKLTRKKSFRRLPGFGLWRCRGFRFRLRLKRLRIMICGRKF